MGKRWQSSGCWRLQQDGLLLPSLAAPRALLAQSDAVPKALLNFVPRSFFSFFLHPELGCIRGRFAKIPPPFRQLTQAGGLC